MKKTCQSTGLKKPLTIEVDINLSHDQRVKFIKLSPDQRSHIVCESGACQTT